MSRCSYFTLAFGVFMAIARRALPATSLPPPLDGLSVIPAEAGGYQNDRLELKDGHFRYWHSGDTTVYANGRKLGPKYPIRGAFRVEDRRILFSSKEVDTRYIDLVNGHTVLWRLDGKLLWERKHQIYDYGVLIRVPRGRPDDELPSVRVLYDAPMRKKL